MTIDGGGHPVALDLGALGIIAGSFAGVLPSIASLIAAIYYSLLIYDRIRGRRK